MEEYQYAGFWIRLGATLIDSVILMIVTAVSTALIYGSQSGGGTFEIQGVWDLVINYLAPAVLTIWLWQRYMGTPGKMALKLRIIDAQTGQKPSLEKSVIRYFAYFLSVLPCFLGFIWIGVDRRKQGWHDKLAGTVVVRDMKTEPVSFERGSS